MVNTDDNIKIRFCGLPVVATPGTVISGLSQATFFLNESRGSSFRGTFFYGRSVYDGSSHNSSFLTVGLQQRENTSVEDGRYAE
jgi:hypothetical protein